MPRIQKYRELVELKGLLREKKINYETLAKHLKISISAVSNKINGKTVFDILEANKICNFIGIKKEDVGIYFFLKTYLRNAKKLIKKQDRR